MKITKKKLKKKTNFSGQKREKVEKGKETKEREKSGKGKYGSDSS